LALAAAGENLQNLKEKATFGIPAPELLILTNPAGGLTINLVQSWQTLDS
jgi:hypothetical protein